MKSEEAIAVVEILSPMTPAFGYTRRLAFFDPFLDVLRLIHRLGLVSSKELALLRLSTTSERSVEPLLFLRCRGVHGLRQEKR
ncbi:unnamed protein product [Arabidopsis halleri]